MSISLSGVHVTVDDIDAALAFYRDTLGLTVRNDSARANHSEPGGKHVNA